MYLNKPKRINCDERYARKKSEGEREREREREREEDIETWYLHDTFHKSFFKCSIIFFR